MSRRTYKAALRAKGIKPIPHYRQLRTRKDGDGPQHEIVAPLRKLGAPLPMLNIGGRLLQLIRVGQ